jgi:hypothetical protein
MTMTAKEEALFARAKELRLKDPPKVSVGLPNVHWCERVEISAVQVDSENPWVTIAFYGAGGAKLTTGNLAVFPVDDGGLPEVVAFGKKVKP